MTEISTNYQVPQTNTMPETAQIQPIKRERTRKGLSHDEFWRREKRKNTGLIERFYNALKNATGIGVGSKKVEKALDKVKTGEISQAEFKQTVQRYNSSQETSAQVLGDLMSVGAAGLTYFGLRNDAKLHFAGKQLNEKFGAKTKSNAIVDAAQSSGARGFNLRTIKRLYANFLGRAATSKTKLAVITATIAGLVGGAVKMQTLQINRIGSQEFKTDKKDFNGARNGYDAAAYKGQKRINRSAKLSSNFRNFVSGAVNGLLMPLSVVGGAVVGIPAYFVGNSLNRYFIAQRHNDKSASGYMDNLLHDGLTHTALGVATLIPMAKKGRFSAIFDKNLEKAFNEINAHEALKDNPYSGKSTFQEVSDILFENSKIKPILDLKSQKGGKAYSIEDRIRDLSEENIFAVKLKQIQSGDDFAKALQEDCPPTRTLEEAAKEIQSKLGKGYKVKTNMGTGTIAETYLAETPDGKEVCIKMLKRGITAEKIAKDKQKYIDVINGLKDKTDAEKRYLIKNVENLADSVSKEIDFENEMKAAQKLVEYTKTAKVVKPIEVKDGLYIMEKADGMSLKKLLEINKADYMIKMYTKAAESAKEKDVKEYYAKLAEKLKKEKGSLASQAKDIMLTEKEADTLVDEYMKVLVEQLYKTDKSGRTLHADIHPGNIFIDVKALRTKKEKPFTLIDTGNTIDLTADQAERSMKLTQFIEHGDSKDLAKYFIQDADLSASKLTKEDAEKKIEEELNKIFFNSDLRLNTMNNNEIIKLTSNIMKNLSVMPGDSQFALNKARTSAEQSYISLLQIWFQEAIKTSTNHTNETAATGSALWKLGKLVGKINEYYELQQAQERKNLWSMIKSPKQFFESQTNPNYKEKNSKEYLIYHLKQDIKKDNKIV